MKNIRDMIYLKQTKNYKVAVSKERKKHGDLPEAFYDSKSDRIVIVKAEESIVGLLNHEFMHRILIKNSLTKASDGWDSVLAGRTENWLGWHGQLSQLIDLVCRLCQTARHA